MAINNDKQHFDFKIYLLFIFSYFQFVTIFISTILLVFLLILSILQQAYILEIDIDVFLKFVFEPILFGLIIATPFISLGISFYYWRDLNNNTDLDSSKKRQIRSLFIRSILAINSYYYDYKYGFDSNYFLQSFFRKTRNKIFGSKNGLLELKNKNGNR